MTDTLAGKIRRVARTLHRPSDATLEEWAEEADILQQKRDRLRDENRKDTATIARLRKVIEENAQAVHQGYHTDMKGIWRDCAKDSCMSADIAIRGDSR